MIYNTYLTDDKLNFIKSFPVLHIFTTDEWFYAIVYEKKEEGKPKPLFFRSLKTALEVLDFVYGTLLEKYWEDFFYAETESFDWRE